jgi:hypothetical protein
MRNLADIYPPGSVWHANSLLRTRRVMETIQWFAQPGVRFREMFPSGKEFEKKITLEAFHQWVRKRGAVKVDLA